MKVALALILILGACSFKKKPLSNQVSKGHSELYSYPDSLALEDQEQYIRLSIASFNDLEAQISPLQIEFKDNKNKEKQSIKVGGKDTIAQYLKILREHSPNTLLLDSGDIFSPDVSTTALTNFYQELGFDAITLGMNDFNIKLPEGYQNTPSYFKDFAASSKTPLVLSNLYDLKTARHIEWPGVKPYLLKEVGKLKVGIIGLIPDDLVGKTTVDNRLGLFVENMLQSTLRQARLLRSLGANIIVVTTHQNLNCGLELAKAKNLPLEKVNFEPRNQDICDLSNVLGEYVKRLPPQLVDLVIGGRSEQKVANYVGDTLVLSGFAKGVSFNLADFYFDSKTKELVVDKTQVYQPIMTCHEFFKETRDCYYKDETINHKERTPAKFLGTEIIPTTEATQEKTAQIDYFKALKELEIDLIFNEGKKGITKILKVEMSGKKLIKILEEEYNLGHQRFWYPNPFVSNKNSISIYLGGNKIDRDKNYIIGLDLESKNASSSFSSLLKDEAYDLLPNKAWNDYLFTDNVSTKLSANANGTKLLGPGTLE